LRSIHRKAALITLGCPKNDVDSEIVAGELVRQGIELVGETEQADLILVNTCGFIEEAKKESIEAILRAVGEKTTSGSKTVYVWGCLSQRYREEIADEIPEVDHYFGVEPFQDLGRTIWGPAYEWDSSRLKDRILSTPSHTAYLKIADGCDHRCTFCAIPLIKGPYRSRPIEALMEEAVSLGQRGVKELILIAQDTTSYGKDLASDVELTDLLQKLAGIESIQWIRLMYAHPAHVSEGLIELMASEPKICRYMDLPLQHISDPLRRAMGRSLDRPSIERLIQTLRNRVPDIVLRTAFIVGFPGETDTMFEELIDFVRDIRFERLGAFVFSPEQGTEAAEFGSIVVKKKAQKRYERLMEVQQTIAESVHANLKGRVLPVLVDGFEPSKDRYFGRTEGDGLEVDGLVWIEDPVKVGVIVPVKIQSSSAYDLYGKTLPN
jgi:ribosomal protein S12 methylthiotransferase